MNVDRQGLFSVLIPVGQHVLICRNKPLSVNIRTLIFVGQPVLSVNIRSDKSVVGQHYVGQNPPHRMGWVKYFRFLFRVSERQPSKVEVFTGTIASFSTVNQSGSLFNTDFAVF